MYFSPDIPNYELDHFETTPSMSTFSFGFVISQLSEVNVTKPATLDKPLVKVWGRKDFHDDLLVSFTVVIFFFFQP